MRRTWIPFVATVLFIASAPRPLLAADTPRSEARVEEKKDKARKLALEGFEHMQKGKTEPAIALFLEAEKLYHAPTIVLLLAQANEKLGRIVEARAFYRSILDEDLPRSSPREYFDAKLEAKMSFNALDGRFATVQVRVPDAKAGDVKVLIDGVEATPFDALHPVNPGSRKITVSGRGGSVTQTLTLKAGDSERMLVPSAALDPLGAGSFFVPAATTFGIGLLGVGAGAVMAGMAVQKTGDVEARCTTSGCSAREEVREAETLGIASAVSFVAGGASLATSAILLYVGKRGGSSGTASLSASPSYIAFTGSF